MATITEDYVSFETAKLLKEKGFDQNCATYYLDGQVWRHYHCEVIPKGKQIYAAPTLQMACNWLREKHHVYFETFPRFTEEGSIEWSTRIYNTDRCVAFLDKYSKHYTGNSYEQATEAAIKYCLENLI